jgi:chromosome segregation ATPase
MKHIIIRSLAALPAVALFAAAPSLRASETTARVESNAAEISGDAAKAALKEIDAEIDVLDDAVDNAPTAADKSAAKARLDALKERRSELRKTYVRSRFDELKADVRAESNRIGSWSKRTYKRDPVTTTDRDLRNATSDARRDASRAGDRAYATAASTAAAVDLESYKRRATDTDRNEAKAALKALDDRIDALKNRVDNMPKGADRDIAKRRAQALEDRKDQLEKDFNKERFNALVDEVQAQWNDPRH